MAIKLLFTGIFLLLLTISAKAQNYPTKAIRKIVQNINESSENGMFEDSVIRKIQSLHTLVIGYAEYNTAWVYVPVTYNLIGLTKRKCIAYRYTIFPNSKPNEQSFRLDSIIVTREKIDSIISIVKKNKPWQIKHSDIEELDDCSHIQIEKPINCSISDANSKALFLLTKSHHFTASYYAPEFYEHSCCPGNMDRKNFLATIAPIFLFFNNSGK